MLGMARRGLTHGDLSAHNLLVHDAGPSGARPGRPVVIDLPQVVDVVGKPRGTDFPDRDVRWIGDRFVARGLPADVGQPQVPRDELLATAGVRSGGTTSQRWSAGRPVGDG